MRETVGELDVSSGNGLQRPRDGAPPASDEHPVVASAVRDADRLWLSGQAPFGDDATLLAPWQRARASTSSDRSRGQRDHPRPSEVEALVKVMPKPRAASAASGLQARALGSR